MTNPASYISQHLLPAVTLSFIGGIACAPFLNLSGTYQKYFSYSLVICLLLLALLYCLKKATTLFYLLLPMFFGIGFFHGYQHLQLPHKDNHIFYRIPAKTDCLLIGTMLTMEAFDGKTSQVTIDAKSIRYKENSELFSTTGKVRLQMQGPWPKELSPGDTLAIRAELKRPDSFRTPGVFDYARYLAQKDIWITGFIRSPIFLAKLEVNRSIFHKFRFLPEKLRTIIGDQIDKDVLPEIRGVYRALLIGDRSHIDEETLEIFKASGTMHILAISGLHLTVIGGVLYFGFFWLFSRSEKLLLCFTIKKWAAIFSLPALFGYGLLAGMNSPVFRALLMSSIVIIAICTNRKKSPAPLLAFAAMVILTIDPLQLFTVSFQLSFSAIIGILFLLPVLKGLLHRSDNRPSVTPPIRKISNWVVACILVSLTANLATAPIALASFNRFSVVGPIANLFMEPLICLWGLAAGFFAIPFIFIEPEMASFFLNLGSFGLNIAIKIATFLSSFSISSIWLPTPAPWLLVCYFLTIISLASFGWKKRCWTSLSIFFLFICIVFFVFPPSHLLNNNRHQLQISYLDVGQGTATFVEYPSGFKLLIDGGGSSFSKLTVGESIIAPFLWARGIQKIDAIAITHPDADHYNGLHFILKHFSPKILWLRDTSGHDNNYKNLIKQAKDQHIRLVVASQGNQWSDTGNSLECIANIPSLQEGVAETGSRSKDNSGLILKVCSQQLCALFPGDIDRTTEQALTNRGLDLRANILLSPHHGSITSNSRQFLKAVSPEYLLVSAGRSRNQIFPHKGLGKDCQLEQIQLFTTAEHGTLEIISNPEGYQIYGYQRKGANPLFPFIPILLGEIAITPR